MKPCKLTDRFMYVFFDSECTQDFETWDGYFEHVPKLICAQQMCSKCEAVEDLSFDCEQCGKRTDMDAVGKYIYYLRLPRPVADKIDVISHNSRGYDAQFLLCRFLEPRWVPQLIMHSTKIVSISVENLHFFYSLNFMPMILKSMSKSFDITRKKSYYSHFFKTAKNLDYVGPYSEPN